MSALVSQSSPSISDRVSNLLDEVDYRPVGDGEDREQVYRLRYDAYLAAGMTAANAMGVLKDRHDEAANSWTFGLYIQDRLASSIRISVASREHGVTSAVDYFPEILGPDIERGSVIVDPNRLVTDRDAARLHPDLAMLTVRLGYVAAVHFDADVVIATVRAEHRAFYKRVFGMRPDCLPRVIPPIQKPFCLMSFRNSAMEPIMVRYPVFRSTPTERALLFDRFEGLPGVAAPAWEARHHA